MFHFVNIVCVWVFSLLILVISLDEHMLHCEQYGCSFLFEWFPEKYANNQFILGCFRVYSGFDSFQQKRVPMVWNQLKILQVWKKLQLKTVDFISNLSIWAVWSLSTLPNETSFITCWTLIFFFRRIITFSSGAIDWNAWDKNNCSLITEKSITG